MMSAEIRFVYSGYAYTPVMGELPVFCVRFKRGDESQLHSVEVRAQNAYDAHQIVAKRLGVPYVQMGA